MSIDSQNLVKLGAHKIHSYQLKDLTFQYAEGGTVFKDLTMTLPMNTIVHVSGPRGHGQSTLLKVLALLAEPARGGIIVNGRNVSEMSFEEFLPWRLEIGYTFEMGGLLANRTLLDNLLLPHLYHNLSDSEVIRAEIQNVAKRFRFEDVLDRRPASVSGGLRKLVTILRPVLLRPSFLVMDDPFSGLDSETSRELKKMIFEFRDRSEIETIYFTSRNEMWPSLMDSGELWVENGQVEFRELKAVG